MVQEQLRAYLHLDPSAKGGESQQRMGWVLETSQPTSKPQSLPLSDTTPSPRPHLLIFSQAVPSRAKYSKDLMEAVLIQTTALLML